MQSNANYNAVKEYSFSSEKNGEPVTKEQAKSWMRITNNDEDTDIENLIIAARSIIENYLNKSIIKRTVTAVLTNRCGNIELPFQPFEELVSITDADGNAITSYTLSGDKYKRLLLPEWDNIKVVYKAGIGIDNVPQVIKNAIMAQVAFMYVNRGDDNSGKGICPTAKQFLSTERR